MFELYSTGMKTQQLEEEEELFICHIHSYTEYYRHVILPPPPDHSPLFASIRWPGQAGLTSAGSVAAGSDGCLLGRIHFPCGFVVYVLLCC